MCDSPIYEKNQKFNHNLYNLITFLFVTSIISVACIASCLLQCVPDVHNYKELPTNDSTNDSIINPMKNIDKMADVTDIENRSIELNNFNK
jgi:hypothetical protein